MITLINKLYSNNKNILSIPVLLTLKHKNYIINQLEYFIFLFNQRLSKLEDIQCLKSPVKHITKAVSF